MIAFAQTLIADCYTFFSCSFFHQQGLDTKSMPSTRHEDEKHIPALASREDRQLHQQITTQMDILSRRFSGRGGPWVEAHKNELELIMQKEQHEQSMKVLGSNLALLKSKLDIEEDTRGSAEARL